MIGDNLRDALNQQITNELGASYFYLSMAGYFEHRSLPGFASWMRLQHQEESAHAMKIFNFVTDRSGRVTLGPIDAPASEFDSVEAAIAQALEHERMRYRADLLPCTKWRSASATTLHTFSWSGLQRNRWRRRRPWRSFWTTCAWSATTERGC